MTRLNRSVLSRTLVGMRVLPTILGRGIRTAVSFHEGWTVRVDINALRFLAYKSAVATSADAGS